MLAIARLSLSSLLALLPGLALAMTLPGPPGPLTECTGVGVYRLLDEPRRRPALGTTAGYSSVVNAALVDATATVPLELGQMFGLRFSIADQTVSDPWLPVEFSVSHPPIPDHRGELRHRFTVRTLARREPDGRYHNRALYILSERRELVAGDWQLQVRYRGTTICRARFEVIAQQDPEGLGPSSRRALH